MNEDVIEEFPRYYQVFTFVARSDEKLEKTIKYQ